jgi:hypothetical protein
MTLITTKDSIHIDSDNVKILDFNRFNYLDVYVNEKLPIKDLKNFLQYKIIKEFKLNEYEYEYFYLHNPRENDYQVYSIKKTIFSEYKKKVIIPKNLSYINLPSISKKYYLLLIEEGKSSIMLYINGFFIFLNYVSFHTIDLDNHQKIQELSIFINELVKFSQKHNKTHTLDIKDFYIHTSTKHEDTLINIQESIKDIINFENIKILKNKDFIKYINIDFCDDRKIYITHPLSSLYLGILGASSILFIIGYLILSIQSSLIKSDTKELEEFYNKTNLDVKQYYVLKEQLKDINQSLIQNTTTLNQFKNHSRINDITDILVNVFKNVKLYDVYLESIEIKNIGNKKYIFVDVKFHNKEKIKRYLKSSPNHFVQKISQEGDMYKYLIKAEIK